MIAMFFFFFKQKTAYEMRISDWSSDVCSSDLRDAKSEFVGILRLWDAYRIAHEDMTQSQLRKWCDRNFLGFLRMREWRELHRQLKLQCEDSWGRVGLGLPPREAASVAGQDPPCGHVERHRAPIAGLPTQLGHRRSAGHPSELQSIMRTPVA